MKTTRKLIPALAMLVIAAVTMSTASYAWFSMNTQVSATGMQIKATTSRNLLISLEQAANFGPTVAISTGSTTLVPCSATATTNTATAIYTMADRGSGMSADNWAMGANATFTVATQTTHYAKSTVYIKSTGSASTNLKCAIDNSATSAVLEKALRVMIVYSADNVTYTKFLYTPISGSVYGANAISSLNSGSAVLADKAETISTNESVILDNLAADTVYKFDIYVWYEGQDTSCFATNAQTVAGATLGFTFTTVGA